MSHVGKSHTGILLCGVFGLLFVVQTVSAQEKHQEFWSFFEKVQDILAGRNVDQAQSAIAEGARFVSGIELEDLRAVVAGEVKGCVLADSSFRPVMMQVESNESEDAGYIILKTSTTGVPTVKYHTVVFMRDPGGQYAVKLWHAGTGRL